MPVLGELVSGGDRLLGQSARLLAENLGVGRARRVIAVYVPGRVEFLGKHTDYAGGRSLLMAVERGFRLLAAPREDNALHVTTGDGQDVQQFPYGKTPPHPAGHWVNYVATVARRVARNFASAVSLRGADVAFASDLPIAAGMSSSSALMVATFLAISALNDLPRAEPYRRHIRSNVELAEYLGCVENGQSYGDLSGQAGVGTFGGSEDHTSMLCCKAGMLSQFSFAPSRFEREIPFPAGVELVIAVSGVHAVKTASAMELYNRASLRARKTAEAFNRATGADCRHLREIALRVGGDGVVEALAAIRRGTPPEDEALDLPARFEQFFREDQQIIPAVGDALLAGEVERLGALVDASHAAAARGLQNQVEQTDFLQKSAREAGALAASYFGAGFGGSVWAMVPSDGAEDFRVRWQHSYVKRYPDRTEASEFFLSRPGRPAEVRPD